MHQRNLTVPPMARRGAGESYLGLKLPSSSSSSMYLRGLGAFTPPGASCWIMCMSDITEWDTPLRTRGQDSDQWTNSSIMLQVS